MARRVGGSKLGRACLVVSLVAATSGMSACADRSFGDEDEFAEEEKPPRPVGDGGSSEDYLFAGCETVSECGGLDYCLRPRGEVGFCSTWCEPGREEQSCGTDPGLDARCEFIEGESICVLSCANGPCPMGMKCEDVKVNDERERICF